MTDNFKQTTGSDKIEVDLTVGDDMSVGDDLSVGGDTNITGKLTVNGGEVITGGIVLAAGEDLVASSTSNITVNTNKFTVAGATGNTVVGGTLGVTGKVTADDVDLASGAIIAGVGTGANGIKLKNLKNAATSELTGTALDVEIDIGGTPYYFHVYPTKA